MTCETPSSSELKNACRSDARRIPRRRLRLVCVVQKGFVQATGKVGEANAFQAQRRSGVSRSHDCIRYSRNTERAPRTTPAFLRTVTGGGAIGPPCWSVTDTPSSRAISSVQRSSRSPPHARTPRRRRGGWLMQRLNLVRCGWTIVTPIGRGSAARRPSPAMPPFFRRRIAQEIRPGYYTRNLKEPAPCTATVRFVCW